MLPLYNSHYAYIHSSHVEKSMLSCTHIAYYNTHIMVSL